jgi:hypothetical protein
MLIWIILFINIIYILNMYLIVFDWCDFNKRVHFLIPYRKKSYTFKISY